VFIRDLLLLWGTVLDASTLNAFEKFEWILIHVPLFVPAISYCISYRDNQLSMLPYIGLMARCYCAGVLSCNRQYLWLSYIRD
jgi:hypothetical protein